MSIKVLVENPLACIRRVLSVLPIALMAGWAATAVAGTPENLVSAATRGDVAVVQALIASGDDVDAKANNGVTALTSAKDADVRTILVQAGAKE